MGRRAKAAKIAQQIVVTIGDTTVEFPLDHESLRSRGDSLLAAKRLRPLAVDYLRRMEIQSHDPFMDETQWLDFDSMCAPFSNDGPWAQDALDDFSISSGMLFENEMNCDPEAPHGTRIPRIDDAVWK
jgi:hypothetical protein